MFHDGGDIPERRNITVVFADVVGSTPLSKSLTPDDFYTAVRRLRMMIRDIAERHDAVVSHQKGDASLLVFGYPQPSGQDAARGLRAALDIQAGMAELDFSDIDGFDENGLSVRVRVGVNSGSALLEAQPGPDGTTLVDVNGSVPNNAHHFQAEAEPGTIVVGAATHALVDEAGFVFGPPEPFSYQGGPVTDTVRLLLDTRLPEIGETPPRGARIFGRESELDHLARAWRATADGHGRLVRIVGSAGLGKTTLMETAIRKMAADGARLEYFHCFESYQRSPYYPIAQRVRWHLRQNRLDASQIELLPVFRDRLGKDGPLFARAIGLLLPEAGASPATPDNTLIEGLVQLTRHLSTAQPLVLVCENIQWADDSTKALIHALVPMLDRLPILLIVTTRDPGDLASIALPDNDIHLETLSVAQTLSLCAALDSEMPDTGLLKLAERSLGIPLYAEILMRAATEAGTVDLVATDGADLPSLMHDLVLADLSKDTEAYELARHIAVLGEVFLLDDVAQLIGWPATKVRAVLGRLNTIGQIAPAEPHESGDFRFTHLLYRDAIYQTLWEQRRRALHAQCHDMIRQRLKQIPADTVAAAFHAAEARMAEEAAGHWLDAARIAVTQSANREALDQIDQALEQTDAVKGMDARNRLRLKAETLKIAPMIAVEGFPSANVRRTSENALEQSILYGLPETRSPIVYAIWASHQISGDARAGLEQAEAFHRLASETGDPGSLAVAYRLRGTSLLSLGELERAIADLDRSMLLLPEERRQTLIAEYGTDIRVTAQASLAIAHWLAGRRDEAFSVLHAALDEAAALKHKHTQSYAFTYRILLHHLNGDAGEVMNLSRAMEMIAEQAGLPFWLAVARTFQNVARADLGEYAEAIPVLEEQLAFRHANDYGYGQLHHVLTLAHAHALTGGTDRALDLLAQAEASLIKGGEYWYEPEVIRRKAELLDLLGRADEAHIDDLYRAALAAAETRRLGAFWDRAAASWIAWADRNGRSEEVRNILRDRRPASLDLVESVALLGPS